MVHFDKDGQFVPDSRECKIAGLSDRMWKFVTESPYAVTYGLDQSMMNQADIKSPFGDATNPYAVFMVTVSGICCVSGPDGFVWIVPDRELSSDVVEYLWESARPLRFYDLLQYGSFSAELAESPDAKRLIEYGWSVAALITWNRHCYACCSYDTEWQDLCEWCDLTEEIGQIVKMVAKDGEDAASVFMPKMDRVYSLYYDLNVLSPYDTGEGHESLNGADMGKTEVADRN